MFYDTGVPQLSDDLVLKVLRTSLPKEPSKDQKQRYDLKKLLQTIWWVEDLDKQCILNFLMVYETMDRQARQRRIMKLKEIIFINYSNHPMYAIWNQNNYTLKSQTELKEEVNYIKSLCAF